MIPICRRLIVRPVFYCVLLFVMAIWGDRAYAVEREMLYFQDIPVVTAAKHEQMPEEAPSFVTVITDDQIKKFGYRDLSDALSSVPGFFITNDRNYEYVGVRGFARPGDYNMRILFMVDGHRINDDIYGGAFPNEAFAVDMDIVKRIEVIRGPGSALYGNTAFFAVVNVITKDPDELKGAKAAAEYGGFNTNKESVSYGTKTDNGAKMLFAGSVMNSEGQSLFFKEFNDPSTNNGISNNCDYERASHLFMKANYGEFSMSGAYEDRTKGVPTGSYGTVFNDPRNMTEDGMRYLELKYDKKLDDSREVTAKVYYDYADYYGDYILDYPPVTDNRDLTQSFWYGTDVMLNWSLSPDNKLILGSEYQNHILDLQQNYDVEPYALNLDESHPYSNWSAYVQDEMKLGRSNLTLGVRTDNYPQFGGVLNPRIAYVINPYENTHVKFLYGSAFRAPSQYELYYSDGGATSKPSPDLIPEKIYTYETVLEQVFGPDLRGSLSAYKYDIYDLISQTIDPSDGLLVFDNIGRVSGGGIEMSLRKDFGGGSYGFLGYANQRAVDQSSGSLLTNSPENVGNVGLVFPVFNENTTLATELKYVSQEKTLQGEYTYPNLLTDLNLVSRKLWGMSEVSLSVKNFFNENCGDPGSGEHPEDIIYQDGREYFVKVVLEF